MDLRLLLVMMVVMGIVGFLLGRRTSPNGRALHRLQRQLDAKQGELDRQQRETNRFVSDVQTELRQVSKAYDELQRKLRSSAEQLVSEQSPWWPVREGIRARANASQENPTPASQFAATLLAAVARDERPALLRIGNGCRRLPLLQQLLPRRLMERMLSKRFGLDTPL